MRPARLLLPRARTPRQAACRSRAIPSGARAEAVQGSARFKQFWACGRDRLKSMQWLCVSSEVDTSSVAKQMTSCTTAHLTLDRDAATTHGRSQHVILQRQARVVVHELAAVRVDHARNVGAGLAACVQNPKLEPSKFKIQNEECSCKAIVVHKPPAAVGMDLPGVTACRIKNQQHPPGAASSSARSWNRAMARCTASMRYGRAASSCAAVQ